MTYDAANGCLVLAALVCAAGTGPKVRGAAMVLAGVFALNWLHFVTSYGSHSLAAFLWGHGIMVHNETLWMVADALTGVFALTVAVEGGRWGLAIWLASVAQLLAHGLYWEGAMLPARIYYPLLDAMFWAQAAVFILAGGGGVVARIGRVLDRSRDAGRSHRSGRSA